MRLIDLAPGVRRDGVDVVVKRPADGDVEIAILARYPVGEKAIVDVGPYRSAEGARREIVAARPLYVKLVVELEEMRMAKAAGVNREYQTGDEGFDGLVYVDSPAEDRVLAEILDPTVRDAVRALLALGARAIELDDRDGKITATLPREAAEGEAIIAAFVAIVRAVPAIVAAKEKRPAPEGRVVQVLTGVTLVLMTVAVIAFLTAIRESIAHSLAGGGIGAVIGFALIFVPRNRGRSNSMEQRQITGGLLLFSCTSIGVIAGSWL